METETTLRELEALLQVQKPKKADLDKTRQLLSALILDAAGRTALTDRISRGVLRKSLVFDTIVDAARETQARSPSELDPTTIRLLAATASHAKINDAAKWVAFDFLLCRGEIGVIQQFAEALDGIKPKHDLARVYGELIRPNMAEGGVAWLRKVLDGSRGRGLKAHLQPILDNCAAGRDASKPAGEESGPVRTASGEAAADRPAMPSIPAAVKLLAEVGSRLEQVNGILGALADQHKQQESKLADVSADLQASEVRIKALAAERDDQTKLAASLEEANSRLQGSVEALEKKAGELQQQTRRLADDLEKARAKAKQDVAIAQAEAQHAVQSFRHELWTSLSAHMLEAKDLSIDIERLPVEQQILLRRLRTVLDVLQRCEVAPGS